MSVTLTRLVCVRCGRYHCHWCGRSLDPVRPREMSPSDPVGPTRDHYPHKTAEGVVILLACYACNSAREQRTDWVAFHDRGQVEVRFATLAYLAAGAALAGLTLGYALWGDRD